MMRSHLTISWLTDDPVSVNGNAHDGEGGHVDCHAGEALDQPEIKVT